MLSNEAAATHGAPLQSATSPVVPRATPPASVLHLRTREAVYALRDDMHAMLTVAQYVASSMSVFDAMNFRADHSPEFAATMGQVHATWRDPDSQGETMGALAQLIGMACARVHVTCAAVDQLAGVTSHDCAT